MAFSSSSTLWHGRKAKGGYEWGKLVAVVSWWDGEVTTIFLLAGAWKKAMGDTHQQPTK